MQLSSVAWQRLQLIDHLVDKILASGSDMYLPGDRPTAPLQHSCSHIFLSTSPTSCFLAPNEFCASAADNSSAGTGITPLGGVEDGGWLGHGGIGGPDAPVYLSEAEPPPWAKPSSISRQR